MKNYIVLAVSVMAGLAAFFLHKSQLEAKYRKLGLMGEQVKVVTLRRDLVQGDTIDPKLDLTLREMYRSDLSGQEVTLNDVHLVNGRKLAFDVKKNVPLMLRDIEMPDLNQGGALASRIQSGNRALSITVDGPSSVSSLIHPNDHIDILGTFRFPGEMDGGALDTVTLTLLQNVTVLATGQQLAGETSRSERQRAMRSYSTLTLSLTPEEAELIVFAEQQGKLTMTLRNPHDVYAVTTPQKVNFDYLQQILSKINASRASRNQP